MKILKQERNMRYILTVILLLLSVGAQAKSRQAVAPDTETQCLAYAIRAEARGEPVSGMRAVLDVIQNRMRLRDKNACDVIKEPGQFPWYKRGMSLKLTMEDLLRFIEVNDMEPVLPNMAEYFHAYYVHPKWSRVFTKVATIGHHRFYANDKEILYAGL